MRILQELIIPQESVNDDRVVILDLSFKNGDSVKKGDVVLEFETSKATVTLDVMHDGFIFYNCIKGDRINVGSVVAKVYDENKIIGVTETPHANDMIASDTPASKTIFSKKAKLLLKEKGLNENDFSGKDFVGEDDILNLYRTSENIDRPSVELKKTIQKEINISRQNVHIEKISTQKIREIEYLSAVQCYGLNSTVSVFVEVDNVLNFVNFNMPLLKGSFLPIIIYESSRLLKKYPKMNSFYEDDSIVYYDEVNVGIAMDMDKGLKVLKMPNSEQLSIMEIEKVILDLSRKYYEDKTTVKDVSDVTFTITDLSGSGVATFFPLINKHNSAILAVSSVDEKLKRLNLTVTFDHRVTEGKYAAAFLYELKTRVESYSQEATFEGMSMDAGFMCFKCHRKLKDEKNSGVVFLKILGSVEKNNIICSVCYDGWYEGL